VGDPVAGVAAIDESIAEEALELIKVEYEVLEPVTDPEFGTGSEAPLIHPDLDQYKVANFILPQPGTNISNYFKIRKGDVDSAWGIAPGRNVRLSSSVNIAYRTYSTYRSSHTWRLPRWKRAVKSPFGEPLNLHLPSAT
jgi:CO/xanthine dehydrogenase Mo-binding subunit